MEKGFHLRGATLNAGEFVNLRLSLGDGLRRMCLEEDFYTGGMLIQFTGLSLIVQLFQSLGASRKILFQVGGQSRFRDTAPHSRRISW